MSKAGRKGMAGMVMAIPISVYSTGPRSHARSDLVELRSESMGYYSLVGIQLE